MSARLGDYLALTKPRIAPHVLLTAAAGYWLGLGGAPGSWPTFIALLAGSALISGGTLGLNQWWERDHDARMTRTRGRPLASGRLTPGAALRFCVTISVAGALTLWLGTNLLTAVLACATLVSYVLVYTPLKRITTLNTLAGSVPGALPILGGWTAASGRIEMGALALFAILFVWQLPHVLALAWLHRGDYQAGGFVMVGRDDPNGRRTAAKAGGYGVLLLAVTLSLAPLGVSNAAATLAAGACTVALAACALWWAASPTPRRARRAFIASIVHLPVVLLLITLGRA